MLRSNNHKRSDSLISDSELFNYTNDDYIVPFDTKRIVVHQSVTSIKPHAFLNNTSLESISIPNSVTTIGEYAFQDCSSLVSIVITDGVASIGASAVSGCSSLVSNAIPDGVSSIGKYAFQDCSSLVSITVPNGVTSIGEYAFMDCSSLISIVITDGVTSIGAGAFNGCSSLVSIAIPDGLISIGAGAFDHCSSLVSIAIPDGVTSIGAGAFNRCSSLVSIAIPQGVTSIGRDAFYSCTLLDQRQTNASNYSPATNIWLHKRFAHMPIHLACYNATAQTITSNRLSNIIQANNTTLLSTDAMGMTALHVLCCNPNTTVNAIKALKDANPNAASIRNAAGMTPLMLLLKCKGQAYDNLFEDGELLLPLVGMLELGVDYDVLEMVMGAFDDGGRLVLSLDGIDEESRLFPFMQAALLPDCALDVVYMLAMMRPDLAAKEQGALEQESFVTSLLFRVILLGTRLALKWKNRLNLYKWKFRLTK